MVVGGRKGEKERMRWLDMFEVPHENRWERVGHVYDRDIKYRP